MVNHYTQFTSTPRVLHIIDHPGLGGAQRLLGGILNMRSSDLMLPLRKKPPHLIETDQILFPANAAVLNPLLFSQLPGRLRQAHIDIIHCHLTKSWITGLILSALPGIRRSIPFLFHAHNSEKMHTNSFIRLARMASRVGKIVAVSQTICQQFMEIGIPAERLHVLYNFVDPTFMAKKSSQNRLMLDPKWIAGNHLVGFAGRLTSNKGVGHLIYIMERLQSEPIKFLIAGLGPYEQVLNARIQHLGLEDKVLQFGFLNDLPRFYHSVDVFVSPSLFESFGLVQLEAQACGCPVVAFRIPALAEVLMEGSALLSPPGDPEAMAQHIRKVTTNPALKSRLVEKGLENASRYSPETQMEKLADLYRQTLLNEKADG